MGQYYNSFLIETYHFHFDLNMFIAKAHLIGIYFLFVAETFYLLSIFFYFFIVVGFGHR